MPWSKNNVRQNEAVTLEIDVPKTQLKVGEEMVINTKLTPLLQVGQGMYAIVMNIPPGFVLQRDPLNQFIKAMWISSYEVRGNQLFVYIDEYNPGTERRVNITLVPTTPATVQLGPFQAFEYYNREVSVEAEPVTITVMP